jgi:hypothetical protein
LFGLTLLPSQGGLGPPLPKRCAASWCKQGARTELVPSEVDDTKSRTRDAIDVASAPTASSAIVGAAYYTCNRDRFDGDTGIPLVSPSADRVEDFFIGRHYLLTFDGYDTLNLAARYRADASVCRQHMRARR